MNHRRHLLCLLPAIALAAALLLFGGGNATFAGVGLALLLCPLVMGTVMWLLMRQPSTGAPVGHHVSSDDVSIGRR
ncbi:MAG: hypothetical protein Q7V57_07935 [Actinomycetota bacterium]|nr:hypothetical protein [Actinomycetota bacterium]